MIRQIEIQIEPCQVPVLLLVDLVNVKLREDHAALAMIGVGQRHEPDRKNVFVLDFVGGHLGKTVPAGASAQLHAYTSLNGLPAEHRGSRRGLIAEVVSLS